MKSTRKKPGGKLRLGRRLLLVTVLLVLGNYLWRAVTRQDILNLDPEKITVTGNTLVSDNSIISALDQIYGENILRLELREIEEELADGFSRIRNVSIRREFPDGLNIKVSEVDPAGYLIKDSVRHVVTGCGRVFPGTEGPGIKFMTGESDSIIALSEILEAVKSAAPGFYSSVTAVDISYRNEVIIYAGGLNYRWHALEDLERRVVEGNLMLSEKARSRHLETRDEAKVIDMRFVEYSSDGASGAVVVR